MLIVLTQKHLTVSATFRTAVCEHNFNYVLMNYLTICTPGGLRDDQAPAHAQGESSLDLISMQVDVDPGGRVTAKQDMSDIVAVKGLSAPSLHLVGQLVMNIFNRALI